MLENKNAIKFYLLNKNSIFINLPKNNSSANKKYLNIKQINQINLNIGVFNSNCLYFLFNFFSNICNKN